MGSAVNSTIPTVLCFFCILENAETLAIQFLLDVSAFSMRKMKRKAETAEETDCFWNTSSPPSSGEHVISMQQAAPSTTPPID
jgi:hypothetical protein